MPPDPLASRASGARVPPHLYHPCYGTGKTTIRFTDLIENEITSLASDETQFGLMIKFSIFRNNESQYMEHCFKQIELVILGINNEAMINDVLYRFIDQVKDEIEPKRFRLGH